MNDKSKIFSHILPADYDEFGILGRLTSEVLVSRLELVTLQPEKILDIGCGTGYSAGLLKQQYPDASIVTIDAELSMLQFLKQKQQSISQSVVGAAEKIPLKKHSIDLIFANLLLPWCVDWAKILIEWRQILRSDGLFVFSCFGPDTLHELTEDLQVQCIDMHDIGDQLLQTRFLDPVVDIEKFTLRYRNLEQLTNELKQNGLIAQSSTISPIGLDSTYEIIYGHAWAPDAVTENNMDEDGVVRVSLDSLRGRRR